MPLLACFGGNDDRSKRGDGGINLEHAVGAAARALGLGHGGYGGADDPKAHDIVCVLRLSLRDREFVIFSREARLGSRRFTLPVHPRDGHFLVLGHSALMESFYECGDGSVVEEGEAMPPFGLSPSAEDSRRRVGPQNTTE